MRLTALYVPMSNVPDFSACLVIINRQDTSELDAVGVHVGPVNVVLNIDVSPCFPSCSELQIRRTPVLAARV